MSSVDDRIVNMKFNSSQFTQGAAQSEKALTSLETALTNAGKSTALSGLEGTVEKVSGKFSALKVAGVTALATIANKATNIGLQVAKSLTISPITAGFDVYETKINAIRTILSNTASAGTKLPDVTKALKQLNNYANLTVYNFGEMAKNVGTFTAAGVDLKTSVSAIKGIANLAALSGATSDQASSAMYQLSQAIAAGQVHLQDWNSVVNAGIGGAVFQKNLIESALATGTLDKSQVHLGKTMRDTTVNGNNFRQSLTPPPGGTSWLTSDVLTKSLGTFTGSLTKAQLVAKGFAPATAAAIAAQGKTALNAATQIKTFSQLLQALKEEVASSWATVFEAVFGNITQATKLFSSVHTVVENALRAPVNGFAEIVKSFRVLGGFTDLFKGFINIFKTIGNLFTPFITAFKVLLPAQGKAGQGAANLAHAFEVVTGWIEKLSEGAKVLTPFLVSVAEGIKAIFGFSAAAIKGLAAFVPLFIKLGQAAGSVASSGLSIATNFVSGIVKGLNPAPLEAAVTNLATSMINWIKGALGIHSPATEMVPVGTNVVLGIVQGLVNAVPALLAGLGKVISAVFKGFGSLFKGFDATDFASLLNAIFTAGLLLTINRFAGSLTGFVVNLQSLGSTFKEVFEQTGKTLKTFQQEVRARALEAIAIAVGLLVASLIALTFIKSAKLATGLGAIASLLGLLSATLFSLSKINKGEEGQSLATMAASLIAIAVAINGFALAIAFLGRLKPATVAQGMGALAGILATLVIALKGLNGLGKGVAASASAMVLMATALDILVAAVTAFGLLPTGVLTKGFTSLTVALFLMTTSLEGMAGIGPEVIAAAAAMGIMAGAMLVLSGVVLAFGKTASSTLVKGFKALAVALGLMVVSLLVLGLLGPSVLAAAGAMAIMAVAIAELVPSILALGSMDTGTLVKGIVALAAIIVIFGVALAALGVVASVVGPGLLILGAALALIGIGMLAFGTGFALMAAAGAAGTAVLIATIHAVLALLPEIAVQVATAFVAFIKVIANATGPIRSAMGKIMTNVLGVITDAIPKIINVVVKFISELLKGITKLIPQYGKVISQLIKTGLTIITKAVPEYIKAGTTIVLKVVQGLGQSLPKIVDAAGNLIVKFITALGKQANKIVDAAGKTILSFLKGLDKAINKYEPQIIAEGGQIAKDIVSGLVKGLGASSAINAVVNGAKHLASSAIDGAKHVLHINSPSKVFHAIGVGVGEGLANGIDAGTSLAVAAAVRLSNAIIAEGNRAVLAAQRVASKQEAAAEAAKKRAQIAEQAAKDAEKHANKVAHTKGATKAQKKAANLESAAAKRHADNLTKIANQAGKQSDRAAQHVQDVQAFQSADDTGKGDIDSAKAEDLASRANKKLADANAEAAAAKKLMSTNRKAALALLAQSRKDAKTAEELAKRAKKANADADKYYTKAVDKRIKQMESDSKARADQEAFDNADSAGQEKILTDRATAEQAASDAARKRADDLIARAKKLAKSGSAADAKQAAHLLDLADAQTQIANDQADAAKQDKQEAADLLQQAGQNASSDASTLSPSASVLEDAASVVDRYTASLAEAQELASATVQPIQYVQNNYSPVALSESEIYRQSKNLMSYQQTKMGAPGVPINS